MQLSRTLLSLLLLTAPASATDVRVTVTGTVAFNQIGSGPLGGASSGDPATLSFLLDSTDFVDSASFPTRGYRIDVASFVLDLGNGNAVGLQDPFPAGETPYFVLRDDDPAVDGFFVATSVDFPIGVPLDQTGIFGQFRQDFSVTYGQSTLASLDLLDALGSYDFAGLTVFGWTILDGPFEPLGIDFATMEIAPAGPASYCAPAAPNSVAAGGAQLVSTGGYGTAAAGFQVTGTPDQFGILFSGTTDGGQLPFGCGTRCVGGSVVRYGPFLPAGNALSVTIDMSIAPANTRVQWWFRDPAGAASCGSVFNLSNALIQ